MPDNKFIDLRNEEIEKLERECLEYPEEEYDGLFHAAFAVFTCKDNIPNWVTFQHARIEAERLKRDTGASLRVVKCGWTYFII